MNLDKIKSKEGIWYEDADGNYIPFSGSVDEIPENAVTEHVCFPLEIRETIRSLRDCDGNKITDGGSFTSCCHIGGGNSPVIIAMVQSGDFTLSEALAVYSHLCERCVNALAYHYLNGADGYPEYSEEWKKCGTVCECCKDMEANHGNTGQTGSFRPILDILKRRK